MECWSDLLRMFRVRAALFARADCAAPWGVHTRGAGGAIFHLVLQGGGFVRVEGGAAQPFGPGDLLLLPHGARHDLSSAPEGSATWIRALPSERGADGLPCVRAGQGPVSTRILCGALALDPEARDLLLPVLPPLVHARGGGPEAAWVAATVALLGAASAEGGAGPLLERVGDVLLVQALRCHFAQAGEAPPGWLGALVDPVLGPAVRALHAAPAEAWTAERLARRAGTSRSQFYARFLEVAGETPGAHLLRWRVMLARRALREGDAGVAAVADAVGYASEAAFNRAFKRATGLTPARWRRAARAAPTPALAQGAAP